METQTSTVSFGPLEIHVGLQRDGCAYELRPRSRDLVRSRFPHARPARSLFVGYDSQADFEAVHGPMWDQVALMLTGLTAEQLRGLGGYVVRDPVTGESFGKGFC